MDKFNEIVSLIVNTLWGSWLPIALIGIGIYFTIGNKFLQFNKFSFVLKRTIGRFFDDPSTFEGEGTITPAQSVSTALASTVGVGNIVGVAAALIIGGPGAVFWMWFSALLGMATKYSEIVLSIRYREKNKEGFFVGGPAYYIKKGLNSKFLAAWFTIGVSLGCLGGNMLQSNAISGTIYELTSINKNIIGIVLAALVAIVSIGGVKRLGKVTEKLVPVMAFIYVLGGLVVIIFNFSQIPEAFASIFKGAFSISSVAGGVAGYTIRTTITIGILRGLYSNEAGQGTAPIAHAAAKTTHPSEQGLWGVTEVFLDTIIVCTITALAILTSGVMSSGESEVILASLAFGTVSPILKIVVSISIILFAYSTIIALSYYGESQANSIGGYGLSRFYRYLFIPFTFIGAIGGLQAIWGYVDLLIAFAVIPNLIAIALLSPKVFSSTKEYFNKQ